MSTRICSCKSNGSEASAKPPRRGRVMPPYDALLALTLVLASPSLTARVGSDEPIRPLPPVQQQNALRVDLGRELFADPRLSANNRVSCLTCHDLRSGGADRRSKSVGFDGQVTAVNAPSVFNAALNFRQFWNGRADSLEAQIDAVIQNPVEMGSTWEDVIAKLSHSVRYRQGFAAAYRDGITKANVTDALASFERTLITTNARFDQYLRGDDSAISATEKLGYAKFKQYGCVTCHQGVNVGGNMLQRFGVMGDYFAERGQTTEADLGRFLVTGKEGDKHVFKVPSLRNVALTPPYFHDGSAQTLADAVDVMFRVQLGRLASREDKEAIVSFLGTLSGELQATP